MGDLLSHGDAVLCGPVVAELLVGTPSDRRSELASLLDALPWSELGRPEWHRVGVLGATLRSKGMTVSLTDIEIAVAAEASDAALWTFDQDFGRLGEVMSGLRLYSPLS